MSTASLKQATKRFRAYNDEHETITQKVARERRYKLQNAKRFLELLSGPRDRSLVVTSDDVQGIAKILHMVIEEMLETA